MGTTNNLIDEFYEELIEQGIEISKEECKQICESPFKMLKEAITGGTLKDIRLPYFGIFKVNKSRVKYSLKNLEKKFQEGLISEEKYNKRKQVLTNI